MTLFRKVFLNQARPASVEDGLDETALRDAFRDMASRGEPLILDPFARVNLSAAEEKVIAAPELEGEDQMSADSASATLPTDLADASSEMTAPKDQVEEFEETESAVAEMSAALHRVIDRKSDTPDEDALVPEDDFERETEGSPETPEEDLNTPEEDMLSETDAAPEEMPEAGRSAEQPPQAQTFDLAAFAQSQMQALADQTLPLPAQAETISESPETAVLGDMPAPAVGRAGRHVGRVKTRLLGFNRDGMHNNDPFSAAEATATAQREKFPVGWLVVVEGPGRGHSFSLFTGASMIGRGEDQVIRLDFGDNSISRQNHAAIAYDEEQNKFYLGHGGKSNIIRRNARPVLSTEELNHADLIRIGETTLRFVALCGSDFQWDMMDGSNAAGL